MIDLLAGFLYTPPRLPRLTVPPESLHLPEPQNERRQQMLQALAAQNQPADLYQGSPCLFCLRSLALIPWQPNQAATRALPVLQSTTSNIPPALPFAKGA